MTKVIWARYSENVPLGLNNFTVLWREKHFFLRARSFLTRSRKVGEWLFQLQTQFLFWTISFGGTCAVRGCVFKRPLSVIIKKCVLYSGAVFRIQTSSHWRWPRHLSCSARVIVGVDDNALQYLPSYDDNVFGTPAIANDRSSSEDEWSLQLSAKVPRVAVSWSDSNSSSSESCCYLQKK